MNLTAIGGRKFLLSMATMASATVLVWLGHISDGVYSAVIIAINAGYIAGNVMQKINSSSTAKETK